MSHPILLHTLHGFANQKHTKPYSKKKQVLIAAIAALFFIACGKNNSNPAPPATVQQYFRGKLNGVFFSDSTTATIVGSLLPTELYISGHHANGLIVIWLKAYTNTTGERIVNANNHISFGNNGAFFYAGSIIAGTPVQGSGKVNILEITSTYIRGTFECMAPADSSGTILPPQSITEGEFKLKKP